LVNEEHLFTIEKKISQYQLTLTSKGSSNSTLEKLTEHAEKIYNQFTGNNNKEKKMTILPKLIQEKIAAMPETGMGYHNVTLILKNNIQVKNAIVVNGSILKSGNINPDDIIDVK